VFQGVEHGLHQTRLGRRPEAGKRPFAASWLINGLAVDPLEIE
jgi:hypothetical protein